MSLEKSLIQYFSSVIQCVYASNDYTDLVKSKGKVSV